MVVALFGRAGRREVCDGGSGVGFECGGETVRIIHIYKQIDDCADCPYMCQSRTDPTICTHDGAWTEEHKCPELEDYGGPIPDWCPCPEVKPCANS